MQNYTKHAKQQKRGMIYLIVAIYLIVVYEKLLVIIISLLFFLNHPCKTLPGPISVTEESPSFTICCIGEVDL